MEAVFVVLVSLQVVAGQQCYAVALEGGGGKGAYEAGVLFALANSTAYIQYNAVSGISIGSVNAGLMASFPMGQEKPMADYIKNFWMSLNGSQSLFKEWPGGYVDGLLFQAGLVDNSPAQELSRVWITGPPKRNITVGSSNIDLGLFQTFNESVGLAIIDAITCSSSIPFFFAPHQFEGYTWVDGGTIINLDVFSAVERCLIFTNGKESNVVIDMIFDDNIQALSNQTTFKTPDVFMRVFNIHSFDKTVWFTYNTMAAYPNVNYRYAFVPSVHIQPPLNFTKANVEFDFNLGVSDAQRVIKEKSEAKDRIAELFKRIQEIIYP